MTIVEKIIRRSYSKSQLRTSMEIELYNDDYSPVSGAQIALLMAKCMNGPLHCQYVSARIQYDESLDWEDLSEGELARQMYPCHFPQHNCLPHPRRYDLILWQPF
jgi:hypothetical protein